MIQSDRSLPLLSLLAISLFVGGAGCNSQSDSEYQEFAEIEEVNGPSTDGDPGTAADVIAAVEPLRAPRPEVIAVSAKTTSGTNGEGELVPLKAVKPVFGQTSRELKDNIENIAAENQETREIKVLVKKPSFRREEGAYRVSYDDIDLLKVLNMEPVPPDAVSYFPDWLANLDGKRIRIRGFMYPTFRQSGIDLFVLARDNQICCFGRNPKIYDLITVEMKPGVTTDYILNRPFDVIGTFHIRPDVEDGELFNLYEITDAVVVDK